jgi:hypothetical protein
MSQQYVNEADKHLYVGQSLYWYPHGDKNQLPHMAKVLKINPFTVNILVWAPGTKDGRQKDGVRHMSDPQVGSEHTKENGGWAHNPGTEMLRDTMARLAKLEKELAVNAAPPVKKDGK